MLRLVAAFLAFAVAGETPAQLIGMPPPAKARHFGWAGPEAVREARVALGDQFPQEYGAAGIERVITADEYAGQVVRLWDFVRDRNGGKHWPTIKQEIGDCVSHGWSHGALFALGVHQVLNGDTTRISKPFPPYVYGVSRVLVGGGKIRGDGSVGSWAAAGVKEFGYVDEQTPGCPRYSGSLARQWGRSGPPANLVEVGKRSPADVRLIRTWDELVSAIATGHPVPVCSGVGFERIVERNGRVEGVRQGSWPHCMCFIGVDCRAGFEAVYCFNSWGPDAHAPEESYARLDGAPPGGFWVLKADAVRMLREEDSFAVSFGGFAAPPLWNMRGQAREGRQDEPLSVFREAGDDRRRRRVVSMLVDVGAEYRLAH